MIRILQCVVKMDMGGIETMLINLYRNIDRTKIQFDFLTSFDGVYDQEIRNMGGQVYNIPFITQCGPFAYAKNLQIFFSKHPEYKTVHIHMDKFGGMVAKQAAKCNVPVRIVHSHSTKNEGGIAYNAVKNYYGCFIKKYATHFFACGKDAANWLFKKNAEAAIILKNGIDLNRFAPLPLRNQQHFTIGHIGRFTAVKNHKFLINIFNEIYKQNPSTRLVLVGEGAEKQKIMDYVVQLGLASVVAFLGACGNPENIYPTFDVLCMPSIFEGLPLSLVEAQACGIPCVVSTGVCAEANIAGNMQFVSLSQPYSKWASVILQYKNIAPYQPRQKLIDAGYDINTSAAFLQNFYLSHYAN